MKLQAQQTHPPGATRTNSPSKKRRHHCVSFCDDITVLEFECDQCTLSVHKPPLCVSRNLRNFLFLPQPVSKFFDRYLPRESEKKNILALAKDLSSNKYQRKCTLPHSNPDKLKLSNLFNQCSGPYTKDEFLSMTSKERQWLASIQIHQLNEIGSTDYYFKKYMAKTNPGETILEPAEYLKDIKTLVKKQTECPSPEVRSCLGRIPMFTVAHARQVLEDKIVPSRPDIGKAESNPLLTIEYSYDLLLQLEDEADTELRESLVKSLVTKLLRVDDAPQLMNIHKGQNLYMKLYSLLDDHFVFWKAIFQSLPQFFKLNKSTRPLNAFLSLFKSWLMSNTNLAHVCVLAASIEHILSFLIADKFGMSIISLLVICSTNVTVILNSDEDDRKNWATFLSKLILSIDYHPHVENPLIGSRKLLVNFLSAIAPSNIHLKYY